MRIETRGGLIEKKKVGIADQGAGQSQPLFLAAGEIAHPGILFFFELHPRDDLGGSRTLPKKAAKQADRFMDGEFLGELGVLQLNAETLAELRAEYPTRPLCLVVGMDAFLGLPKWHQWRELLTLGHLAVAHRPGWRAPTMGPLGEMLVDRGTGSVQDLHTRVAGRIYIHAVTQLEIYSTEVRGLIGAGRDPRYLMPDGVRRLIHDSGCYARKEAAKG